MVISEGSGGGGGGAGVGLLAGSGGGGGGGGGTNSSAVPFSGLGAGLSVGSSNNREPYYVEKKFELFLPCKKYSQNTIPQKLKRF